MFSIITSAYNVNKMKFDWQNAIENWVEFLEEAGEIIIAVNKSEDDSLKAIQDFIKDVKRRSPYNQLIINVIDANIDYNDPEFDGKLKDLALSKATYPYVILLDLDERIVPGTKSSWHYFANKLSMDERIDGWLVPVINLHHDLKNYSNMGFKWYLHKNSKNIKRGVVKWAYREDGSIDITKSDTTEAIYRDSGELIRARHVIMSELPDFIKVSQLQSGNTPFVYHLGTLDIQQRIRQNAFWEPVWRNRDKSEVNTQKTEQQLKAMPYFPHNLPIIRKS